MQQVFIALPVHLQGLSLAPNTGRNKRMVFSFLCTQQLEGTFDCPLIQSMQSERGLDPTGFCALWNTGSYRVLSPTGPRAGTKVGVGQFSKLLTSRNPILV